MWAFDVFHPATRVFVCCCCLTCQYLNFCGCGMLLQTWTVNWALLGFTEGGLMRLISHHSCFSCCPVMVVNNKFSLLLLVWGNHFLQHVQFWCFSPCCEGICLLFLSDSSVSHFCGYGMLLQTWTVDWALQGFTEGSLMRLVPCHNCFACCPVMVVNNKFSLLLLIWGNHFLNMFNFMFCVLFFIFIYHHVFQLTRLKKKMG